jgi:hypothetical protein
VNSSTIAVYTTIYPGVEPYLADWANSVRRQTDRNFELWIGLDSLPRESAQRMIGSDLKAHWVPAPAGSTAAQIRQQALARIVESCEAVVLVDSDDVLHSSRVEAARTALRNFELSGCALRFIDQQGASLGFEFNLPSRLALEDVFPRNNVFGFSTSSFRCELLKRCMPIPTSAVMADWLLATRAWMLGARLSFDRSVRMDYRQHASNLARLRYPLTREQIVSDTGLVRRHYRLVLAEPRAEFRPERWTEVECLASEVDSFHRNVLGVPEKLDAYIDELNTLTPPLLWWSSVAHPSLSHLWRQ